MRARPKKGDTDEKAIEKKLGVDSQDDQAGHDDSGDTPQGGGSGQSQGG
jgi:hypothetical protein